MSLKIGGKHVRLEMRFSCDISNHKSGSCNTWVSRIDIAKDTDISVEVQEESLMHEIIETLNNQHELNLEHHKMTSLSEGLYQVLKDNGIWDKKFTVESVADVK